MTVLRYMSLRDFASSTALELLLRPQGGGMWTSGLQASIGLPEAPTSGGVLGGDMLVDVACPGSSLSFLGVGSG